MRDLRVSPCHPPGGPTLTTGVALVVFDLAGTTIKDSHHVASAFVAALAEQDIRVGEDDVAAVRGASKREAIARFIPEGPDRARRTDVAYAAFREHLGQAYRENGVQAIDGAESLFRDLRGRSIRVALNTGFERDIAEAILNDLQWGGDVIDAVVCGDDVSLGRPAPFLIFRAMERTNVQSVHQVVNVGDTTLGLRAGHNAGVRWNVGVLTGAHDRKTLSQAPHTHLIESIAQFPNLL